MAEHLSYWTYREQRRQKPITCARCRWQGLPSEHEEYFSELLDVCCPSCEKMLLIVGYPTPEETRAAAAVGVAGAREECGFLKKWETRMERAAASQLREPSQLPHLDASEIRIEWDFEKREDEVWTVLRHQDRELWRELAYWEGGWRFAEVFEILRGRYGAALREVRPTAASKLYLYGDRLFGPSDVSELNESLGRSSDA